MRLKAKATDFQTSTTDSQTQTHEQLGLEPSMEPRYRREVETGSHYTEQRAYFSPEYLGKSEASSSRTSSTGGASSFSIQNDVDFGVIPPHYGGLEPESLRGPLFDHLRGWGVPNGLPYHNDYESRLSSVPWQPGFSQYCGPISSHNWSSIDRETSFSHSYAGSVIPRPRSISPVMNLHYDPASFMNGDSPQSFHTPLRKNNYYDLVRDVHDPPADHIQFMDFASSSISHPVQSPNPTQSLPSQGIPVNVTGGSMVDSPPPVSAHTSPVTLREAPHLSVSQCTSGLSEPPASQLVSQSEASLVSTDSIDSAHTISNLEGPPSTLNARLVVITELSISPNPTGSQLSPDSPLTPVPDSLISARLSPPGFVTKYRPPTHPIGPHYYPELVFEPSDFTVEVLGSHVGEQAEVQVWPNGWKTVLPELRNDTHSGNILEADAKAVKWMADPANVAPPEQSIVRYLDSRSYDGNLASLVKDIRSLMAKSFVVVLPNAVPPVGPRCVDTLEDITYTLGAGSSQAQAITYHDMELRARDPGQPYGSGTLPAFLENMKKPSHVHMLLDFPVAIETIPHPFHLLNDGKISAEQMNSDMLYRGRSKLSYLSNQLASKWGLLHMAGTFTYPHVDTAGYAVGGQVAGDRNDPQPKIWAVLSLKDPSMAKLPLEQLAEHFQDVASIIASSLEEHEKWLKGFKKAKHNRKKIPLYPSRGPDMCIELISSSFQPPFILHLVYTPAPCVAFGSHSYGYDTMHLTETARRIQHLANNNITNQVHIGTYETLEQMLLALHGLTKRVFYRRAIAALCLMILFPARYFNGEDAGEQENQDKAAKIYKEVAHEVATFVVCHYLDIPQGERKKFTEGMLVDYLYDGNTEYTDPGPSFTLGTALTEETKKIFVRRDKKGTKAKK
ncbi:hypothetical protein BDP27DRAFT_1427359 [Rhodocollybia butyracea]|uniref:Uncharacterized protein n=1 Tax=Rhodocollybia butyracea TaxID=206335 RepID=A0A9P5PGJ2_9AGAR|nr:hypothetical protein BDP27DRAFT_1427359 [Rhodocollybia butyracea]